MDSRQQFENWITTTGLDADLSRGNHGCYLNPPTHWLYCAWVASRESINLIIHRRRGIYPDADDYEAAIEVAGLRTEYAPETGITAS